MGLVGNRFRQQGDLIFVQGGDFLKDTDVRSGLSDYLYELDDKRWWWHLVVSAGSLSPGAHGWNWAIINPDCKGSLFLYIEEQL